MPEWTKAQRQAIETRGCDVLVSAAAGSGKTTALTERIIERIREGGDITRLLVVTFTKASAADMKKKISEAVRRCAAESPDDERLRRQVSMLGNAEIRTIDSFCSSLVRRYFGELGLSPNTRIPDDAEIGLICADCMENTIDHFYAADSGEGTPEDDIVALSDHIAGSRGDEKMVKTLLTLYDKTACLPRRFYVISDAADALSSAGARGFLDSPYGGHIKKRVSDGVDYYINVISAGCEAILRYDGYAEKYRAGFEGSLSALLRIKAALGRGDYEVAADAVGAYDPPRLVGVKGALKPEEIDYFSRKRTELGNFIKKLKKEYFSVSGEALAVSITRTVSVCRGIVRVLEEFDRRFAAEKRRLNIMDYSDAEHMARELLSRPEIAGSVADSYDEICIDEYQDVNATQDEIFSAIARNNRFMVGDVKQSIYGFRGSDPTLFDVYRQRTGAVFMSDNFRCDEPIVEFTNAVCGQLLKYGTVSYGEEDALRHGKTDEGTPAPVRVLLTDKASEAELVADLAAEAVASGRRPSDIVILMRSAKSRGDEYIEALRRRGISAENGAQTNFFECPEILLMLCLLHVCDNPLYDIYTAGALRSPVFGFSLDELTRLKSGDKRPLFRVLRDAAEGKKELDPELAEKCRDAYETISCWREAARTLTADEVLRMLYRETGIEALLWSEENCAEKGGAEIRAGNLDALFEYARGYESGGFRGLHRFVSYVDSIIENGADSKIAASGGGDTVKLMTVHKSKGLEFPVVILAGCGIERNEEDIKSSVLWNRGAGVAMKLRADDEGKSTVMVDTLPRRGVIESILHDGVAEEMRILYVALTRARERLIVTAGVDNCEKTLSDARLEADFFSAHTAMTKKTFIEWILTSLFASGKEGFYKIETKMPKAKTEGTADAVGADAATGTPEVSRCRVEEYRALIRERLSYKYPFERLGSLPAKLSVSRLEPDILDLDAAELVSAPASPGEPNESALAGTATHLYMQFCDYDAAARDARGEGERILALGYITQEDFDRIRFNEIEAFFRSDIYARIRAATEVWRERRFNVRLPASGFTENEEDRELYCGEELLVQGVIDCFFREADGGIVLLDYKTDRLSPYELSHPGAARDKLAERHARQLSYYRAALGQIFGFPPKASYVYSMHLGREIEIK